MPAPSPDALDAEAIAADIAEWAGIESPSTDAAAVNRMVSVAEAALRAMGAETERLAPDGPAGDMLKAYFPGPGGAERPGIMVLGHLDTVHLVGTLAGELGVKRDGDRLYGPGVLDMKGGVVLALHALRALGIDSGGLGLPVTVLLVPDEEIGSPSTRAIIEREAAGCRYVLVPEPGRPGHLVTGRHAFLRYHLRTYGRAAHAGRPGGTGRSAISAMAALIGQVEGFSDQANEISYRVGNVRGGTFVNVVPTECHAEVLCVAPTPEAFAEVQRRMASLASPDPDVRLEVEAGPVRPLNRASEGTRELFEVAARVAAEQGMSFEMGQFGGGSDGNFTGALGIPTLDGLGPTGDGIHTKGEYLEVSSLVPRARLFAGLVDALVRRNS